jgi:hypothetical protein
VGGVPARSGSLRLSTMLFDEVSLKGGRDFVNRLQRLVDS